MELHHSLTTLILKLLGKIMHIVQMSKILRNDGPTAWNMLCNAISGTFIAFASQQHSSGVPAEETRAGFLPQSKQRHVRLISGP